MRSTAAILFLAAASAWADGQPLTWEPARIVQIEEVVASGVLAPTRPHPAFFDFFSDAIPEADGSVIFIANAPCRRVSMLGREGVYAIDRDGYPSVLIQRGDKVGEQNVPVASIAALEMHNGLPAVRCNLENGSSETFLLESKQAKPGTSSATQSGDNTTGVHKEESAIYWSGPDGVKRLVADMTTRIPDLFEGTFTGFGERVVSFDSWVVFSGNAKDFEGLFAMNMATNRLFLLLDNRALLADRRVEDFQISKSPQAGEDFAMTVTFADGGSGIYLFRFGDNEGHLLFGSQN